MVSPFRRLLARFARAPAAAAPPDGWDARQAAVIAAPAAERLLVDGGPGTGKTAVACARVAHLIGAGGLKPDSVWLISFTRTAVREIRDRIAAAIGDAAVAERIRIATLDSLAWSIDPDIDGDEAEGAYDEAIDRVLGLVRAGLPALRTAAHVIVDEAHDIVGRRADLVVAILERLPPDCGVTVFIDEAQAIYGFSGHAAGWDQDPLVERLRAMDGLAETALETVFRSRSSIFREVRARVLDQDLAPARRLARAQAEIRRLADGAAAVPGDGDLVLFRRRVEVLEASSRLHAAGIPHRLRLSGQPVGLAPWLAAVLGEVPSSRLGRDAFLARWPAGPLPLPDRDHAWEVLRRIGWGADGTVDMDLLRRRLAGPQPPLELCLAETGWRGPILGTIHASKGREADIVHLMLPAARNGGGDAAEEARVLFVGATRARRRLLIGDSPACAAQRLPSGRLWRREGAGAVVEIGRDGDVDAEGLAGRRWFAEAAQAHAAQRRLGDLAGNLAPLEAARDAAGGWAWRLMAGDALLAVLSERASEDLEDIARALSAGGRACRLDGLRLMGVATLAVAPGRTGDLYPPWRESGLILTPVITALARFTIRPNRDGIES
jgi:hypothetical protein